MRILIFGRDGQVGWECQRSLQALGRISALGREDCDLTQPDAIRAAIGALDPDLIINCAAYTAVDRAESEPELAHAVNANAPTAIAAEASRQGAALIHLSTDYVFDGQKSTPYVEHDAPNPMSVYGRTKLLGELGVQTAGASALILRTSWVYAERGHNFVRTILRLAQEREELRIVNDQHGAPTWARSIAEAIAAIVARAGNDRASVAAAFSERGGIYHLTAAGSATWYDFARLIIERSSDPARKLRTIVPITTGEYPTLARRPANSRLSCDRLAHRWQVALPPWQDALQWALAGHQ